jgi:Protein of unknown function (DUF2934)
MPEGREVEFWLVAEREIEGQQARRDRRRG